MPFTILLNGRSKEFDTPPGGTTSGDVKEMVVGAFDCAVSDGTYSLRSLCGRVPSVFHAALEGSWELVLIPCGFGWDLRVLCLFWPRESGRAPSAYRCILCVCRVCDVTLACFFLQDLGVGVLGMKAAILWCSRARLVRVLGTLGPCALPRCVRTMCFPLRVLSYWRRQYIIRTTIFASQGLV